MARYISGVEAEITPVQPVLVATMVATSASFADTSSGGGYGATWSWGDGTTSTGFVNALNASGSISGSHVYRTAGIYRVTVTVTDTQGGSGNAASAQNIVVYDPAAGSITGKGTFISPQGAVPNNPSLTGKATFRFSAKYAPHSMIPSGTLVLNFNADRLSFHSTSLDWLVVSGGTAWYEGTGTVNGAGSFGFLVSASSRGPGTGKLRIRIWNKASEAIVYDSQPGAAIPVAPTTRTTSGSIVFRVPKPGKRHQRATALSVAIPGLDLRRRGEKTQSVVKARP
jgi:PKD repeat protein